MKDETKPEGKWVFDAKVADAFDDMLERSIPQYQVMRDLCFQIGCHYRQPGLDIVDLGCSRGTALKPFVEKYGATSRYVGVEVSKPMREACLELFQGYVKTGIVKVLDLDLRKCYPCVVSDVTLCILTLQFTPIEYRLKILRSIYNSLVPRGALILVEKIIGATADIDEMMVQEYHTMKQAHGYSQEDIDRKRLSLEGVLVPVPAGFNETLLERSGFQEIDCFWRWMNFAGWVCVK